MREYGLYIFDFDNTLFDTRQGIDAILSCALPAIGVEYDPSQFTKYLGMNIDQVFEKYSNDPNAYEEFCRRFYSVVNSDAYRGAVPFPETESVLRELKARGKRIGIASGKKTYKIETLLSDRGMEDIPETIVGWDDTERHKPEPDPIALAFSRFDVPKEDALYIGDSPNDSLASEAFGIDCAIVNRHNELSVDGIPCTYEIESLSELLDW